MKRDKSVFVSGLPCASGDAERSSGTGAVDTGPGRSLLGQPLVLPCGTVLPNRLAKAALTEGLADEYNRATDRHQMLYRRWASGGSGLVITGNVQVDRRFLERPGNVAIDDNGGEEQLRAYATAGTCAGNQLWMQLNHPGRQTPQHVHPTPFAPSAIPVDLPGFGQPVAMTSEQINDVIDRFRRAARMARHTGFTGVQIHAAHGYLLSQYLSPRSNQRTDEWGGSLANRARLLLEIVKAVREEVGADFPISVKLNSADFQQGGFSDEDCLQVVRWLEEYRVDLLEISGGTYEKPQMVTAGRTRRDDPLLHLVRKSTREREAYFLEYASRIRAVTRMPLMVTGGFRSVAAMDDALASGKVDVIGLGRPLIVEPEGAAKLLSGELAVLPSYENTLKLESDTHENSDKARVASMRGWGIQGWFCAQLLRLGKGAEPELDLSVGQALDQYRENEIQTLRNLKRC